MVPLMGNHSLYIDMSLFQFNRPANESAGNDVVLIVNEESVTVPGADAQGKTVQQLFQQFASSIADVSRINRYINQGRIVDGGSTAETGTVYSGAIASESKGA